MDTTTPPHVDLVTTRAGEPAHRELLDPVRADVELMALIWEHAESRMPEEPGKTWCIAAVHIGARRVAAAWAAAYETVIDGVPVLKCVDSYEVPTWRDRGLYGLAYAWRHATVVMPAAERGLPALTYVFEPRARHEVDGWIVTAEADSHEPDAPPHHWHEMRRAATPSGR